MGPELIEVDLDGLPAPSALAVNGTNFPIVSAGNGEPILFVHGAWADHRIWCGVWKHVSRHANFMAYTQRHFGDWSWSDEKPYARRIHTEDLIDILGALDRPVHLAGWSYAGGVLLRAAATIPDKVRSLSIYEPSFECEPDTGNGTLQEAREIAWKNLEPAYALTEQGDLEAGMRAGIEAVYSMPSGGFFGLHPDFQRVHLENCHTMLPDLHAEQAKQVSADEFGRITCPTLIMYGENSLDQYRLMAEHTSRSINQAQLKMLDRASHGAPVMRPDLIAAEIINFVMSNSGAHNS